jgi:hypothetical protein
MITASDAGSVNTCPVQALALGRKPEFALYTPLDSLQDSYGAMESDRYKSCYDLWLQMKANI